MSADIDKACATIDRAIAELDHLRAQLAAKDALIADLTAAVRKCSLRNIEVLRYGGNFERVAECVGIECLLCHAQWKQDAAEYHASGCLLQRAVQCGAKIWYRDISRYTGRGRSGFDREWTYRWCKREALPGAEFCWQHNPKHEAKEKGNG